jgi:hypothetical protein
MGPGIGHHSMGEVSSLKVVHRLVQPEDNPVNLGILMDQPAGIEGHSSMVLPMVEDKLAYLKQKVQLLEHSTKEPPVFRF